MNRQTWRTLAASTALAAGAFAQNYQRQAAMVGGGDRDRGKCTIEVVVDGAAEVEIRGTGANLRTTSGRPAEWRRFECTSAMPANPNGFRFQGVDGRGRQSLIRDPGNGGVAVVQIEDRDNGAQGYTFDITWGVGGMGGGGYPSDGNARQPINRDDERGQYRPNYRDSGYYRQYRHGFTADEAIRGCQQSVSTQASRRFRSAEIHFHRTVMDDQPGRQDWVTGTLDVHRGNREERYRFACAVDFESGRVRTAELEFRPIPEDPRWRE